MTRGKRNLVWIIVLLLASGLVFFIERPFQDAGRRSAVNLDVFPGFEPWKVSRITIDGGRLSFEQRDGNWFLIAAGEPYPADRNQVSALLQAIREMKRDNVATRSADKQDMFGVKAGQGTEVVAYRADGAVLADLVVGKKGPDGLSAYMRRADADEVFLQPGTLRDHLDKPVKGWRDRKVFSWKAEDVVQIDLQTDHETVVLNRDTRGQWFLARPVSGRADEARVQQILVVLTNLEADDFAEQVTREQAGLNDPPLRLSVRLQDRSTATLSFGRQSGEGSYYATAGRDGTIMLLAGGVLGILFPDVKDLETAAVVTQQEP